jgi:hypothetical protein
MRWVSIVVVALALIAAGCGGSDDESAAPDETTVEETLTTDEATTDTDADQDTEVDFTDEDCRALAAAIVGVSLKAAAAVTGSPEDFSEEVAELSKYSDRVPEEFRADVQTLQTGYSEYIDALQEAGIQAGETPTAEQAQKLQNALQDVGSEDVTAAYERLNAWGTENCAD